MTDPQFPKNVGSPPGVQQSAGPPRGSRPAGPCPDCGGLTYRTHARGERAQAESCACQGPCPECGGRGHQFVQDERGYTYAKPCVCQELEMRIGAFNQAEIPARYHHAKVESFLETSPSRRAVKYEVLNLRAQFEPGGPGLLLSGSTGTGKTHLMVALLSYLALERGIACKFMDFGYLTTLIKQGYSAGKGENEIIDGLVHIPVLCIDELGKGRGSEWELTVLDALVNRRYNAGRSTFFTTNYTLRTPPEAANKRGGRSARVQRNVAQYASGSAFGRPTDPLRFDGNLQTLEERVGSRIFSRLHEMCMMRELEGEDLRRNPPGR